MGNKRYRLYAKVLSGKFQCNSTVNLPLRKVRCFLLSAVRRSFHLSKRSATLNRYELPLAGRVKFH
jgi:hypothetical protein